MTDLPESPDDVPRLRELVKEMGKLRADDTPDDILERTRLDVWEPPSPVGSATEVEEYLDPATGGRFRSTVFQAAAVAPADYPPDWPFIAEVDVHYVRAEAGSASQASLSWPDPDDAEALVRQVTESMRALGWHEHAVEQPSPDPAYEQRTWFHSREQPPGHQWRLLLVADLAGIRAVYLSEIRSQSSAAPPDTEH